MDELDVVGEVGGVGAHPAAGRAAHQTRARRRGRARGGGAAAVAAAAGQLLLLVLRVPALAAGHLVTGRHAAGGRQLVGRGSGRARGGGGYWGRGGRGADHGDHLKGAWKYSI